MITKLNMLIPMAGNGKRFAEAGYIKIKPLIDINGETMIRKAIESIGLPWAQHIFIINKAIGQIDELKTELNKIANNPIIIEIDYITEGPAATCLLAKEYINNFDPLIIANCDQIEEWNIRKFVDYMYHTPDDGFVVTYPAKTEKNSYVRVGPDRLAIEFAEKKIISEHSLNGIHFWKCGKDFVSSTERMIQKNIRVNNEFYVSMTYNELIKDGKEIGIYEIKPEEHWAVGTPEDLQKYLNEQIPKL